MRIGQLLSAGGIVESGEINGASVVEQHLIPVDDDDDGRGRGIFERTRGRLRLKRQRDDGMRADGCR